MGLEMRDTVQSYATVIILYINTTYYRYLFSAGILFTTWHRRKKIFNILQQAQQHPKDECFKQNNIYILLLEYYFGVIRQFRTGVLYFQGPFFPPTYETNVLGMF